VEFCIPTGSASLFGFLAANAADKPNTKPRGFKGGIRKRFVASVRRLTSDSDGGPQECDKTSPRPKKRRAWLLFAVRGVRDSAFLQPLLGRAPLSRIGLARRVPLGWVRASWSSRMFQNLRLPHQFCDSCPQRSGPETGLACEQSARGWCTCFPRGARDATTSAGVGPRLCPWFQDF
jgi:hypothetical protein